MPARQPGSGSAHRCHRRIDVRRAGLQHEPRPRRTGWRTGNNERRARIFVLHTTRGAAAPVLDIVGVFTSSQRCTEDQHRCLGGRLEDPRLRLSGPHRHDGVVVDGRARVGRLHDIVDDVASVGVAQCLTGLDDRDCRRALDQHAEAVVDEAHHLEGDLTGVLATVRVGHRLSDHRRPERSPSCRT